MITKVEFRTALGMLLTLELDDISDGLILKDIQGLNPVKATLTSSTYANLPGAHFQSARREPRNLIIKLDLDPDYINTSTEDLRDKLYIFFMPQNTIDVRLYKSNGQTLDISAVVEDFDTELFVKEATGTISLMCFDPDLLDIEPITVEGNSVNTAEEFVLSYKGTIPTGFLFTLNIDRVLTEFTIYQRTPDGQIRSMDIQASFVADDIVVISTVRGSKSVTLTRAGVETSLLYALSPQSPWLEFVNGDNNLRVYALGASIPFTMVYTPRYGGM